MEATFDAESLSSAEFLRWLNSVSDAGHDPVYSFMKAVYGSDLIEYDPRACEYTLKAGSGYVTRDWLGVWGPWLYLAMERAGWNRWDPDSRIEHGRIVTMLAEVRREIAARLPWTQATRS